MKTLLIILFILNITVVHANEKIYFKKIPPNITTSDAISAVSKAASWRKWTVYDYENDVLQIELTHRDYKAVLKFSFTEKEIYYSDFTTYLNDRTSDFDEDGWIVKPAPASWVRNLQNDVDFIFIANRFGVNTKEKITHENIVMKLENLKILKDKKLITESDYELKKKEIMSRY